jgi:phage-related protein
VEKVEEILRKIIDWVKNMVEQAVSLGKQFLETIGNALKDLLSLFHEKLEEIVQKVKNFIPNLLQAGKDLMNGLWDGLKSVWESISSWFSGVLDKVKSFISNLFGAKSEAESVSSSISGSHANGLDYVPYNGYIAQLHQGERVLTKTEAQDYNNKNALQNGSTINFYSNEKIDEYEAARLLKQTIKEIDLGF